MIKSKEISHRVLKYDTEGQRSIQADTQTSTQPNIQGERVRPRKIYRDRETHWHSETHYTNSQEVVERNIHTFRETHKQSES